jgi:hypothetical protein
LLEKHLSINSIKWLNLFTKLAVMQDNCATINRSLLAKHISEPITASHHPKPPTHPAAIRVASHGKDPGRRATAEGAKWASRPKGLPA